jgi:uncharacterized phage-associated protein
LPSSSECPPSTLDTGYKEELVCPNSVARTPIHIDFLFIEKQRKVSKESLAKAELQKLDYGFKSFLYLHLTHKLVIKAILQWVTPSVISISK